MPLAYFVVRATVPDAAKRKAFDEWYSREHLPDAAKAFGVNKAWRFWSVNDPSLHQAMYEFADQAAFDTLNCVALAGAQASLSDAGWVEAGRKRNTATRAQLVAELSRRDFPVIPSH